MAARPSRMMIAKSIASKCLWVSCESEVRLHTQPFPLMEAYHAYAGKYDLCHPSNAHTAVK